MQTRPPDATFNPAQEEHERMAVNQTLEIIRVLSSLLHTNEYYRTGIVDNVLGLRIEQISIVRNKLIEQVNKL